MTEKKEENIVTTEQDFSVPEKVFQKLLDDCKNSYPSSYLSVNERRILKKEGKLNENWCLCWDFIDDCLINRLIIRRLSQEQLRKFEKMLDEGGVDVYSDAYNCAVAANKNESKENLKDLLVTDPFECVANAMRNPSLDEDYIRKIYSRREQDAIMKKYPDPDAEYDNIPSPELFKDILKNFPDLDK